MHGLLKMFVIDCYVKIWATWETVMHGKDYIILGFHVTISHIPKLNIAFPSGVLVSSDKRPYRNLTFHSVLARQGSFFCNRVHLNFQALRCVT